MDIGTLTAYLRLDSSDFEEGAEQSESKASGLGSRLGGTLAKGAKVGGAALAGAGVAAVTGAFKTAQYGDELDKTSSKLGVHTDFLQDARHWASQNGMEAATLDRALGRLNQRVGRAADGNEKYAEAFENLGVSIHDSNGDIRATEDVTRDTIEALQGIEDPAERSAAASEVFGTKMARDLMPALEDGSLSLEEATAAMDDMGRMSEDQIATSAEFSDKWDVIKTTVGNALRQGFIPVMSFMSDKLFPAIQDKVIPAVQQLSDWLGPKLSAAADTVGAAFDRYVMPAVQALGDWWEQHGPTVIETAERVRDTIVDFATRAGQFVGNLADTVAEVFETVIGWFQSADGQSSETSARMASTFGQLRDTVVTVWNAIWTVVSEVITNVRKVIAAVTKVIAAIWDQWGDDILKHAQTVWNAIMRVIDGVLQVIGGIFDVFAGAFTGDWRRVWDGVRSIFSGIWDIIAGLFEGVMSTLNLYWTVFRDLFTRGWSEMWGWVRDFASDVWGSITDRVGDAMDTVRSTVSGAVDAISGIWEGLRSAFASPVNWIIDNVLNNFIRGVERLASAIPGVNLDLPRVPNVSTGGRTTSPGRMHSGGLVGPSTGEYGGPSRLRAGERLRILQDGEEVLTADDPRHVGHLGASVNRSEVGGVRSWASSAWDAASGAVSAAASTVRGVVADVARPAVERAMSLIGDVGGGQLGQLVGGAARGLGEQILDWISGVDDEAADREQPSGPGEADLPGSGTVASRLVSYFRQGPPGRFTSGYRPGDPGLHGQHRAADFAGPTPSSRPTSAMNAIFDHFAKLGGLRELIYAGRDWNIIRGQRVPTSSLSSGLVAAHRNHVHAAMDQGGELQPGWNLAYNGLGHPEPLARTDELLPVLARIEKTLDRGRSAHFYVDGRDLADAVMGEATREIHLHSSRG